MRTTLRVAIRRFIHEGRRNETFREELAVDSRTGVPYPRGDRISLGPRETPKDPAGPARRRARKLRRRARNSR